VVPHSLTKDTRFVGQSEAIRRVEADLDCAARSDAKVLITGETGAGKEVVARLIHDRSARANSPLVTLNCAGFPDSLLESELFGHVRGSFTGAYRDKPGLLEMAPTGTLFLDEVAEMSSRMQVVLLRFLETGEIQRVGADRPHTRANVRLITATNRDLQKQIASGAFREDLYFRLHVVHLHIPPLRERLEDVPLLVQHFLKLYGHAHKVSFAAGPAVSDDAMQALMAYRWPGNVRELKNVVERMVLKTNGLPVTLADLPTNVVRRAGTSVSDGTVEDPRNSRADELLAALLERGESFWSAVYPIFMSRDLTRADLRRVIQRGLETTNGSYRLLVQLFNMAPEDYKRFLSFLRKHDCHFAFQRFRAVQARLPEPESSSRALATGA
jgi:transcriptional regulator with PAS, ATPase and Fis domain